MDSKEKLLLQRHFVCKAFKLKKELGRIPLPNELEKDLKFEQTSFASFYSSYENFLRKMSFGKFKYDIEKNYSEPELVEAIRSVANVLGQSPTLAEFNLITSLELTHIRKHFRNFSKAVAAADLDVKIRHQNKFSNERLLRIIKDTAKQKGATPTIKDIKRQGEIKSAKIFSRRFGSFRKALLVAGFKEKDLKPLKPAKSQKQKVNQLLKKIKSKD